MLWGFNRVVKLPIFFCILILVTKVDLSSVQPAVGSRPPHTSEPLSPQGLSFTASSVCLHEQLHKTCFSGDVHSLKHLPLRDRENLQKNPDLFAYYGFPKQWILTYPAHRYHAVPSPGFEPTTLWLRVRHPNHSATTLHSDLNTWWYWFFLFASRIYSK
jgi:hypothetical protein